MKIKPIAIILLTFVSLTGIRLVWLNIHSPPEQPEIENGILDLTNYSLPTDQTITLNGDWEFTDKQLNSPERDKEMLYSDFVTVPSSSSIQKNTNYGTYHAQIKLPTAIDNKTQWGLKLPPISTAYELYIDGELVDATGNVSMNSEEHIGESFSTINYFSTNLNKIDITLLVSNFDTQKGVGISKSIHFGTGKAIGAEHSMNQTLTISLVVVLLLFSVLSLLVYFFIYKKKLVLFFTFGFLLPAIDELTTFNGALLYHLPLNYEWATKFLNLVYLGAAFFFVQFMRILLKRYREARLFTYYSWLYLLCAFLIIVLPVSTLTEADTSFFILYALSFLSVVVLALNEFISDEQTSIFLALTALCTTSGITWGAIKGMLSLEIPFYPFDYLFGLICFAAFWFNYFYQLKVASDELVIKLQEIDSQKDAFFEDSTEKLWGPLNEMITIGQSIYDTDNQLTPQNKRNMKYVIDVGRNMSFTLNDLLVFTQAQDKKFSLQKESIFVQNLMPAIFDMLTYITVSRKVNMTSTIDQNFPSVYADEKRFIQILFNLLHNAVKFTANGEVTVRAFVQGTFARLEIEDTGIGIEKEAIPIVSEPFKQLHDGDKGLGIGLTVAKRLVKLHGGSFEILSTPQKGTIIRFSIPLAQENEHVSFENKEKPPVIRSEEAIELKPTAKRYVVLVVDHDPVNLVVIENILKSVESHVVTTTSNKEAIQLIDEFTWDLVIIEAMLPKESGYSLTQLIRKRFTKLELPILLLTARNLPIDVYTALALGANDHVTKPINALELKIRSHALIDLKKSIKDRMQMETALLQAQIQPHFLFNTLNSIASLSMTDPERMIGLLDKFGKYLQSSFDTDNLNPVISIKKELELVEAYLYIQKERFQQRLTVEWNVTDNLSFDIPPLMLQTLVENAIHHGVLKRAKGGKVTITIEEREEHFFIQVADDGVGISYNQLQKLSQGEPHETKGIGLPNTNRRLIELFNEELQIESKVNVGTTISFIIPT